ncbi:hypothetical protein A0U92_00140 [Acetobacter aceti]|uniref:Uncharacterized protein n=1 Tax=Acetobacter aceti TaxID=435 RepID=A0A1U9KC76_ACEAC|nr:hypothetical protein A0U92_00140 [Acetobacter aceti]
MYPEVCSTLAPACRFIWSTAEYPRIWLCPSFPHDLFVGMEGGGSRQKFVTRFAQPAVTSPQTGFLFMIARPVIFV